MEPYPVWTSSWWWAASSDIWTKLFQTPWWNRLLRLPVSVQRCCHSTGSPSSTLQRSIHAANNLAADRELQHLHAWPLGLWVWSCVSVCFGVCVSLSGGPSQAWVRQSNHPSRQWGEENMSWNTGLDSFNQRVCVCVCVCILIHMDSNQTQSSQVSTYNFSWLIEDHQIYDLHGKKNIQDPYIIPREIIENVEKHHIWQC